jgi:hypothetical protein
MASLPEPAGSTDTDEESAMATMNTLLPAPRDRSAAPHPFNLPWDVLPQPARTAPPFAADLALADLFPDVQAAADAALAELFPALRLQRRAG